MPILELWLAVCKTRPGEEAEHWILILAEEDATGTWYHSTGGPTQRKGYKVELQTKRVNRHGIEAHYLIGEIPGRDKNKVKASVQNVSAKFCQRWVDVFGDLEKKDLVPEGTRATWYQAMENDPYSNDGAPRTESGTDGPSSSASPSHVSKSAKTPSAGDSEWGLG